MQKNNIKKPLCFYSLKGISAEETNKAWEELWEYIATIDVMSEINIYMNENNITVTEDANDFMDYLENKYQYSNKYFASLFDYVSEDEFIVFLRNFSEISIQNVVIEKNMLRIKNDK